jgi:hypothetical protein
VDVSGTKWYLTESVLHERLCILLYCHTLFEIFVGALINTAMPPASSSSHELLSSQKLLVQGRLLRGSIQIGSDGRWFQVVSGRNV